MQNELSGVRLLKAGLNPDHKGAQLSELAALTTTSRCMSANASEDPALAQLRLAQEEYPTQECSRTVLDGDL